METVKTTGSIELTAGLNGITWVLRSEEGSVLRSGDIYPWFDIMAEGFDFDQMTARVAKDSGRSLINDGRHTEFGEAYIHWTATFG